MTLEAALAANTEAVKSLAAALAAFQTAQLATAAPAAEPAKPPKAAKPKAPIPQREANDTVAAAPSAPAVQAAVTYEEVAKAVTDLVVAKGREVAMGVLKTFDLQTAKQAKPEQYAPIAKACNDAMVA